MNLSSAPKIKGNPHYYIFKKKDALRKQIEESRAKNREMEQEHLQAQQAHMKEEAAARLELVQTLTLQAKLRKQVATTNAAASGATQAAQLLAMKQLQAQKAAASAASAPGVLKKV